MSDEEDPDERALNEIEGVLNRVQPNEGGGGRALFEGEEQPRGEDNDQGDDLLSLGLSETDRDILSRVELVGPGAIFEGADEASGRAAAAEDDDEELESPVGSQIDSRMEIDEPNSANEAAGRAAAAEDDDEELESPAQIDSRIFDEPNSERAVVSLPEGAMTMRRSCACLQRAAAASTTNVVAPNKQGWKHAAESYFAAAEGSSDNLQKEIQNRAASLTDFLVDTRRALHRRPELMYQEKETSALIQSVLDNVNISYTTGWAVNTRTDVIPGEGGYGVVADIGTGQSPCVLLRADIDALPIHEETPGIDSFKSQKDGIMHACGHDGHTTMLLGAAIMLQEISDTLPGTVRLIFQPAEEGGAGAKRMIEEGLLEQEPKPACAFGMHVWPTLPSGSIASRPGPLLAACECFEIVLEGVGGHAAMPHLTVDPITTASSVVMNLQTLVSRTISPLESGVCSITTMQAGEAFNVIPSTVLLRGTIRALSTETLLSMRDKVEHIVKSTAHVHGCNSIITYSPDFYPPTVNDANLFQNFSKNVASLVSRDVRDDMEPTMGAEDFSFVAEQIPSTFFLLGQGSATDPAPTNFGLHHPQFCLDESVMPKGVELHVTLAMRALAKLNSNGTLKKD